MEEKDSRVRIMSKEETEDYQGVTINENPEDEQENIEDSRSQRRVFIHSSFGDLGWQRTKLSTKILLLLGGAALLAFLFFVALPVLVVFAGVAAAAWLILHLFSSF